MALAGVFFLSAAEQKEANKSNVTSKVTSKVSVKDASSDLGRMKVTDEKSAAFIIENSGKDILQLFNVSTSCDCTFATVTINDSKSPEFGMHGKSSWVGEVKVGEKATVTAIYKPSIMPVSGPVSREIYVATNDPDNSKLTFTVSAFVE